MAAQECDCDFLTSGQMVIDGIILEEYKKDFCRDPFKKQGLDSNVWVWQPRLHKRLYNEQLT